MFEDPYHQRTSTSSNLVAGKYLGSKDRLITLGNEKGSHLQVFYSKYLNGVDGLTIFGPTASYRGEAPSSAQSLEICGIPRLAKTFAAVAETNKKNGSCFISLVDITTSAHFADLSEYNSLRSSPASEEESTKSAYTSLAFDPDSEVFASGTDAGDVVLWDITQGVEVHRIRADQCGVNKVKFLRSGKLLTLGSSPQDQVKLWDLRMDHARGVRPAASASMAASGTALMPTTPSFTPISRGRTAFANSFSVRNRPQLKCISGHPVQDKVLCGCSSGAVAVWELRSLTFEEFQPHYNTVTDIAIHPRRHDIVITSSADGSVRSFSSADVDATKEERNIYMGEVKDIQPDDPHFATLLTEGSSFTGLDCDDDSGSLLAVTAGGSIYRKQL